MSRALKAALAIVVGLPLGISPASAAADRKVHVDGTLFEAAGVTLISQACTDPAEVPPTEPVLSLVRGPEKAPSGKRSIGWEDVPAGFAIGPAGFVSRPSEIESLKISLYSPTGQAAGVSVVTYYPPNDDGVWRGTSGVSNSGSPGWHEVDGSTRDYAWARFNADGQITEFAPNQDLAGFVQARGGDGEGAHVGFAYGCDSNDFFVDRLAIGTPDNTTVWDFEGYRTRSGLRFGSSQRRKLTVIFGQGIGLAATLQRVADDSAMAGTLVWETKKAGAKRFTRTKQLRTGSDGLVRTRFMPAKNQQVRVRFAGRGAHDPSRSRTLALKVRPNVRAKLRDAKVVQGNTFSISGRFVPKRSAKIMLQKYIRQEWRTQQVGRSRKDGTFTIGQRTTRVGKSYWRIKVDAGGGNTWGKTLAMKLVTNAKPKPPSDPGPTLPPSDPPPPPPEDPPPPPPPGPQRAAS